MRVDLVIAEPQFVDHIIPVWRALDAGERGKVLVPNKEMLAYAQRVGIEAQHINYSDRALRGDLCLVASYGDLKKARRVGRPVVIMEHGAGQSYHDTRTKRPHRSGSFVGARDRRGCVAIFVPGVHSAKRQWCATPDVPIHMIGCPRLDRWVGLRNPNWTGRETIAVTFHWDAPTLPETGTSFNYFSSAVLHLKRAGYNVLGHAHPRLMADVAWWYHENGIKIAETIDEVYDKASLLMADNTSVMFEFAALDRPVVVLNAPFYRRDVEHGMRFWEFADIGVQLDQPARVEEAVQRALEDDEATARRRWEITQQIYAVSDGTAAQRAASSLRTVAAGL